MCLFTHKWGKFTEAVDTGNHIYKAQFRSCEECGKIAVKFLKLYPCGAAEVSAAVINDSLATRGE